MKYRIASRIVWEEGEHKFGSVVAAVSRKHALNKALKYAMGLDCYKHRNDENIFVECEVKIIELDEYWNCPDCGGPRKGSTVYQPGICEKCIA
jgi:hypothetical protein